MKKWGYMARLNPVQGELAALFGAPNGRHLPDMHATATYQDVTVTLLTKEEARARSPKASKPHRIMATCTHCHNLVPAGRYYQHKCNQG